MANTETPANRIFQALAEVQLSKLGSKVEVTKSGIMLVNKEYYISVTAESDTAWTINLVRYPPLPNSPTNYQNITVETVPSQNLFWTIVEIKRLAMSLLGGG